MSTKGAELVVCCDRENDLLELLRQHGVLFSRAATPEEAVRSSPRGSGVMILAQGYPADPTLLSPELFDEARSRALKLYVEYPAVLPDLEVGAPRTHKRGQYGSNLDREVVTSDAFGFTLKKSRIVLVHGCHFVPVTVDAERRHMAAARVSGCDIALFGLPREDVWPILFEHPAGGMLVATTKLSHFRTGRYAPSDAWPTILSMIVRWVRPGLPIPDLTYAATVRPTYGRASRLPAGARRAAMERGVRWFAASRLFIEPSGKEGFREGFSSKEMYQDGSQDVSTQVRADCHGEVSMSLALGGRILGDEGLMQVAANLNDLIYFVSPSAKGPRLDPASPSYGLIGGDMKPGQSEVPFDLVKVSQGEKLDGAGVYYGDDFARPASRSRRSRGRAGGTSGRSRMAGGGSTWARACRTTRHTRGPCTSGSTTRPASRRSWPGPSGASAT